jgi:MFS transporter, NNP family, nitrate/nitrite transporter
MQTEVSRRSHKILFFNTLAFTVCFGAWMLNGVLVTFLVDNQVFDWDPVQIGWLMGIPVLTGAIMRLPAGILTDKFGGRPIFSLVLIFCAVPMYLLSQAQTFTGFALCSFGFGLTGITFAIGIAFTSVWYPKHWQGTALGIFGAGNAGAALTTLFAPTMLNNFTHGGTHLEGWRILPQVYAVILLGMGIIFFIFTNNKKPEKSNKTLIGLLSPLKDVRVWRFGLYYFLVFGMFVSFSQWLVPYFVNVYYLPLVTAGIFASLFSFPSGVIRALGGWMSDRWGARQVMYWILGSSVLICLMMSVPRMDIYSPGEGVMAKRGGVVTSVTSQTITVDDKVYQITPKTKKYPLKDDQMLIFPTKDAWQEPIVRVGEQVSKKQLLAKGVTRIYFQANVWIFAVLAILIGSIWGIGKAAVYKHIPDYFPDEVGVVGGMVGLLGGLGGFFGPVIFGYLLKGTGLWPTCWMFIFFVSLACLLWMHHVVKKMSQLPPGFEGDR